MSVLQLQFDIGNMFMNIGNIKHETSSTLSERKSWRSTTLRETIPIKSRLPNVSQMQIYFIFAEQFLGNFHNLSFAIYIYIEREREITGTLRNEQKPMLAPNPGRPPVSTQRVVWSRTLEESASHHLHIILIMSY